jgi:hypothetical protein
MSCDPNFKFSIDGHDLTIIEADSVLVKPLTVNNLQIFAGETIVTGSPHFPSDHGGYQPNAIPPS